MIRAHMATFPPRAGVLMGAVASILPQLDRLFICLNGYEAVPPQLADHDRITAVIPDRDLRAAGKFAFPVQPDDIVFTIDDDIVYPPDYVAHTLSFFDRLPPDHHVLGYHGNAWTRRGKPEREGWKTFNFRKRAPHLTKVDILGTGTTCQLGRHMATLDQLDGMFGSVDPRHARLHNQAGRWMWILPRADDWMVSTMTEELLATSLFTTVNRARPPELVAEWRRLLAERSPHSGQPFGRLHKDGLIPSGGDV